MDKYIINENTILVMPFENKSKVIEKYVTYIIDNSVMNIIDESCKYYGSNLIGRIKSTKYLTGLSTKLPIVISEKYNLIFFPTTSYKNSKCVWINYHAVIEYYSNNKQCINILLNNEKRINLDVSNNVFNKQLFKASRLETILKRNNK